MVDTAKDHDPRIVVGIDGSPGSRAALEWALTQAGLTGAAVEAVAAWQEPAVLNHGYPMGYLGEDDLAALTQKILDDVVAAVTTERGDAANVLTRTVMGHPAQVLTDAAVGAQLLVVGSRGHGTFAGMLLGSVSQHCVQHAACPVVVVPQ
jgi:nucleotide-binding universal stress UspA family protein